MELTTRFLTACAPNIVPFQNTIVHTGVCATSLVFNIFLALRNENAGKNAENNLYKNTIVSQYKKGNLTTHYWGVGDHGGICAADVKDTDGTKCYTHQTKYKINHSAKVWFVCIAANTAFFLLSRTLYACDEPVFGWYTATTTAAIVFLPILFSRLSTSYLKDYAVKFRKDKTSELHKGKLMEGAKNVGKKVVGAAGFFNTIWYTRGNVTSAYKLAKGFFNTEQG